MFTRVTLLTSLLACLAFTPTRADAQVAPATCDTARERAFFGLGVRKGRNLARQAIGTIAGCPDLAEIEELQETVQAIVDAIVVPPGASELVQCHAAGQFAGLIAEIEELQAACTGTCITDGQFIGEIAAELYCALSIALGGLVPVELFERLATDTCGVQFENACDTEFEDVSTGDPECLPFTRGEFLEVYLEVQNNQCAADPDDSP